VTIDAHHHLWRIDQGYRWLDDPELAPIRRDFAPADLQAELAANGVDHTVLVEGGRCDAGEAALLLAHAGNTPQIAGVVAWADLRSPELAETLAGYRELPGGEFLVGIRSQVQGEADPDHLDRPEVRRGLQAVAAAGLVFDLVIRADQIPAAARAARDLPGTRFVLNHLGKPGIRDGRFAEWAAAIAGLAASPNVTAKVSGLVTEADWRSWRVDDLRPYVTEAVRVFGTERLMFGSDWPVCLLAASYAQVKAALAETLPDGALTDVFGGTAARAYGLRLEEGGPTALRGEPTLGGD
jgi:L-fuconolactonase